MVFITTGSRRSVARHSTRPCTPVLIARRRFAEEIAATDDGVKLEDAEIRKSACHAKDAYYKSKEWARQHHLCMPQVPLPQPLLDIINEWFCLVDDDGSGSLSASELEMAFTACDVPCDKNTITAMVHAITREGMHGDEIYWKDFRSFMTGEFIAGKNLLTGDYVLPGGQSLPFGLIIKRLKRHQLLTKIMAGGEERNTVAKQHHEASLMLQVVKGAANREDNQLKGNSGKVEEHIQAGRRIVSLGESLAHAQHMMATSGEDTYDHTVKQFLRHTDIDEIVAAERARLDRATEATLKRRRQSLSRSLSRAASRRSQSFRSIAVDGDSDDALQHDDSAPFHRHRHSVTMSRTSLRSRTSRSISYRAALLPGEDSSSLIVSRRRSTRCKPRGLRPSVSRRNCLTWNIRMIQRVLRFDDDPEIQILTEGYPRLASSKRVTIYDAERADCGEPGADASAVPTPTHPRIQASSHKPLIGRCALPMRGLGASATKEKEAAASTGGSVAGGGILKTKVPRSPQSEDLEPRARVTDAPRESNHANVSARQSLASPGRLRERASSTTLLLSLPPRVPDSAVPLEVSHSHHRGSLDSHAYQDPPTPALGCVAPPAQATLGGHPAQTTEWSTFLEHCKTTQQNTVALSEPPTPSLGEFVRPIPRSAPQAAPQEHGCMHAHAHVLSLAESSYVSTPDANPAAVLNLWKEMGRAAPHFMRKESWPAESEPCMPAREMQYQPNDIFDDVAASERAAKLGKLFDQPKLADVALRSKAKQHGSCLPAGRSITAHSDTYTVVPSTEPSAEPSAEESRDREGDEVQRVKFSIHGVHVTSSTAGGCAEKQSHSRRSSVRGDTTAERSVASGLEASDSEASVAAAAPSSRSKLSMFISNIKSQIQEQEIMIQREHRANPATSMFGEDSSEGSTQSESTDLGSWESNEGFPSNNGAAQDYEQMNQNGLAHKTVSNMISRMHDAVPERFREKHAAAAAKERLQDTAADDSGEVSNAKLLGRAHGRKLDPEINDWALNSSLQPQKAKRMSGAISWATAVNAETNWAHTAKGLLKSVHLGQVHGLNALRRRILLEETDAQRDRKDRALGFNPWDDVPLDLEVAFRDDCSVAR